MNIETAILNRAQAVLPGFTLTTMAGNGEFTVLCTGGGFDYVWGRIGTTEVIFADAEDAGSPMDYDGDDHLNQRCEVVVYEGVAEEGYWEEADKWTSVVFDNVPAAMAAVAACWGDDFNADAVKRIHEGES